MKKILVLLLALTTTFALAACGGGGGNTGSGAQNGGPAPSAPATVANDTSVMAMSFTSPEGYTEVERFIQEGPDGTIKEKDITYKMADDKEVIFAYGSGQDLTLPEDLERVDVGGKSFAIRTSENQIIALYVEDNGDLYAVSMETDDAENREPFDKLLKGISFTKATTTEKNEFDEGTLSYTLDPSWNVSDLVTSVTESPSGEPVSRSKSFYVGPDTNDTDFIISITIYPNSTVEEKLVPDREYTDQEINGISYKVNVPTDETKPYQYYTQQGNDVYRFSNNGNGGIFSTRSAESEAAFETFMNSVNFK